MLRVFAIDAVLLPLIVLTSVALTLTGPHEGHAGHAESSTAGTSRCAIEAGPASISLVAIPARAGVNELRIGGVPESALEVEVRLTHEATAGAPLVLAAQPGDGSWVTEGVLPLAGPWDATGALRLDRFTQAQGSCTLSLQH
jgi:hypothetical protein